LVGPNPTIWVALVIVDVDLDARVAGSIRTGKTDKVLAGVGARAGDADSDETG